MAHRLRKHADIAAEFVRVTRDDLAAALAKLAADGPLEKRVHSIRQRLKWVRSTLRVVEHALGEEAATARREVAIAARLLASARDADVAAASARVLSATTAAAIPDPGFDRVADALDEEAAAAHLREAPLGEVNERLAAIAEAASRFPTDFDGADILKRALRSAYKRGRRAMRRAERHRATSDLHRWRKYAKHLWHLVRVSRSLMHRRTSKLAARLDRLDELLGLDHDHAMLADRLALSPHDRSLNRQLALIAERRCAMEDEAFALGRRVYSRRPKSFARHYRVAAE